MGSAYRGTITAIDVGAATVSVQIPYLSTVGDYGPMAVYFDINTAALGDNVWVMSADENSTEDFAAIAHAGAEAGGVPVDSPTFTGTLTADNAVFTGAVTVDGLLTASGGANVTGGLGVTGNISSSGTATVGGLLTANSGENIIGALAVTGTVSSSGAATIGGLLTANAGVSVTGAVTATGNISSSGTMTASGLLTANAGVTVTGTVGVTGDITGSGTVSSLMSRLSSTTEILPASTAHAFQVGPDSGVNLGISNDKVQARNNGATATLSLNTSGGSVTLGSASSTVTVPGNAAITGNATITGNAAVTGNLRVNTSSVGGGVGIVAIANATTLPTSNPTGGGILYSDTGVLKYRDPSGNITTIAPTVPVSVKAFGALGDGTTDDTTAIQNALNAVQTVGGTVFLPTGTYRTSAPLTVPNNVTLIGAGTVNPAYSGDVGSVIKPLATFVGSRVIFLTATAHAPTPGPTLRSFAIDGSAFTGSLHAIEAFGPIYLVKLSDLWLTGCTGFGILTDQDTSIVSGASWPFWWWARDVMIENCAAGGVWLTSMTDATWENVYVIQCGLGTVKGAGWTITWAGNTTFTNCRGEWCGTNGFHLTGAWWTGTGAGGMVMTGCSTDRNEKDGMLIDATGNGPLLIDNLMLRRDGRNANTGGGSFSGLNISASTIPITIGTITVFPGVDDNGTGTNSPQNGISIHNAPLLSIGSGYVQANTLAVNNLSTGGFVILGPGIITAVGTPAAPGSIAGGAQIGTFSYTASSTTIQGGQVFSQDSIDIFTAGQGLKVAEGANAKQGTATLNGTTAVVVSNTSVTATSRIFLTIQAPSGTIGSPYVSARTAGTSFSIKSTASGDLSTVAYEIIEVG